MTATSSEAQHEVDVCVVGGGQAALVLGFYLRREAERAGERPERLSLVLLDDRPEPGGAWVDAWTHLSLFSPAAYSSLAGRPMPGREGTPSASDVVAYLRDYEQRYDLPVRRPVRVRAVRPGPGDRLDVVTDHGRWRARAVVTATGTWSRPLWPAVPGADHFGGAQLHAASYRDPAEVPGDRVLVVGGGNSGAQVAADLRLHTGKEVTWVTRRPPRFLPDDVDGRVLFEVATRAVADRAAGREAAGVGGLGDVVAVPEVREARDRCGLRAEPMPLRLEPGGAVWPDGTRRAFDAVLWCTGFRPALAHLRSLRLPRRGGVPEVRPPEEGSLAAVSAADPRVWFLGLGEWCAPASATLIGVNRPARDTARALRSALLGGG